MSRVIDALIAYRILKLLVTPFNKTKAYKLGIIDDKGKVLIKSKQITNQQQRNAYTLLTRFVFNLKRLLGKLGVRGALGSAAAAAIAFLKEETENTAQVEKEVYKYLKDNGFEFDLSENYGEPLVAGEYKVKSDIYDLDGDVVINKDDTITFNESTDNIMGYDIFKYLSLIHISEPTRLRRI